VQALLGLGEAALRLARLGSAREHGAAALSTARRHGIRLGEGPASTILADVHAALGDPARARTYARRGLVLLGPAGRDWYRGRLNRLVRGSGR
jgi:hypothetical protein